MMTQEEYHNIFLPNGCEHWEIEGTDKCACQILDDMIVGANFIRDYEKLKARYIAEGKI